MGKVGIEIAKSEMDSWLTAKGISDAERQSQKEQVELIENAIVNGDLVLNSDTKVFTHTLKFPTEGDAPITSLDYKPRVKLSTVHSHLQDVKSGDGHGSVAAYVAAITGKPKGVIKALDTQDYKLARAIAVFFM